MDKFGCIIFCGGFSPLWNITLMCLFCLLSCPVFFLGHVTRSKPWMDFHGWWLKRRWPEMSPCRIWKWGRHFPPLPRILGSFCSIWRWPYNNMCRSKYPPRVLFGDDPTPGPHPPPREMSPCRHLFNSQNLFILFCNQIFDWKFSVLHSHREFYPQVGIWGLPRILGSFCSTPHTYFSTSHRLAQACPIF